VATVVACTVPDRVKGLVVVEGFGPWVGSEESFISNLRSAIQKNPEIFASERPVYPGYEAAVERLGKNLPELKKESLRALVSRGVKEVCFYTAHNTRTCSLTHALTLTHSLTHSLTSTHTHTLSHTLSHSHPLTHSHLHTLTHTCTIHTAHNTRTCAQHSLAPLFSLTHSHILTDALSQVKGGIVFRHDKKLKCTGHQRITERQVAASLKELECKSLLVVGKEGFYNAKPDLYNFAKFIEARRALVESFGKTKVDMQFISGGHHCHLDYPEEMVDSVISLLRS